MARKVALVIISIKLHYYNRTTVTDYIYILVQRVSRAPYTFPLFRLFSIACRL